MIFLDKTGLTYLWNKIKSKFQEILVSGENIKTINGENILGEGNLTINGVTEISDSGVRTWSLSDGTYKLNSGCVVYYYGSSNTSNSLTVNSTSFLFVTSYSTTYKNFYILGSNATTTRYLHNGYTTSSGGAVKSFNLGSSYLTSISNYVKNTLDYSTSNTTYALSAYQGYVLNNMQTELLEALNPIATEDGCYLVTEDEDTIIL